MAEAGKTREYFTAAISRHIWNSKYRHRESGGFRDADIEATWRRIARALAAVETADRAGWEGRFFDILQDFRFLPGGRIQAGAGTGHRVTLFNCFVMGTVADSMDGIFDGLKEGAITLQQGGGVGYDFSTLRPAGTPARGVGSVASGPVSFMRIWDSMCATLLSTGARRGAMMATLRCDHPDIEAFVDAKRAAHALRHFNLSVLVSDAFMEAVRADADWPLVFPDRDFADAAGEAVIRVWSGGTQPVPCRVIRTVRARELWERIMRATYDYAEPGVLFIDRINRFNNLHYREHISATNPCGEIPLPPYGACDLGSINLTRFVTRPFTPEATLDFAAIEQVTGVAVRLLDNVIDASRFPLAAQEAQAHGSRRVGLGVTGLADTLILLGIAYDSPAALDFAARVMRTICHAAYRASTGLAREKGSFPFFGRDAFIKAPFITALPEDIRDGIRRHGIRNSHLTAIAPTGTISLLANNISSGIEPVFDFSYRRRVLELDGSYTEYSLRDYARARWAELRPDTEEPAAIFVDARRLPPRAHIDMQAVLQPYVDNAISKTVNIPHDYGFAAFREIYQYAYDKGLKGCTTFRPNPVTGEILSAEGEGFDKGSHCCDLEREAD